MEARCARRIGYQSDRAQHVHPAIVPVKHRLITHNRFLVASSILTPFRTRNLARERVSFARSLFSHSRFVSENRSRPSSLFGGLDFETTNYETWKLRPFPDARERNFIIKRRFLIVFFAKEISGFFADFTSLCIGKSLRERASWKWQRWYNLFVPNPAGKMFDNGTNLIADSNRLSGKPGNSPLIGFDEGGANRISRRLFTYASDNFSSEP